MKVIPLKVWNRIEMLQQLIAAVAQASGSSRKRWVAIHSDINKHSIIAHPPHLYYITDIEFDSALLTIHTNNQDEDLAIVSQTNYYASTLSELYNVLSHLGVDPEAFNAPWHVDYPL